MAVTDSMQKKILMGIIAVLVIIGGIYFVGNTNKGSQLSSDGSAEYKQGVALSNEGKFKEALEQYEKSAERGNMPAAYMAGMYLTHGRAGIEKDITKGLSYLKKVADAGGKNAAYALGKAYMDPLKGVKRDYATGIKYIKMSAEKGHGTAMYVLGIYYEIGKGVEKDKQQAIEWLDKAAKTSKVSSIRTKAAARADRLRSAQ